MHSPHKQSHYFKFNHPLGSHFLSSGWLLGYMKGTNYPKGVSHLKLIFTFRPLPIRINSNDTGCPIAQEGPVHWGELFLWNYKRGTQGQLGHPEKACPAPSPNPIWSSLEWVSASHSVVSHSLQPHGLYSPWNSPGQNTGVGSLSLLQRIFPAQGSNPGLPHCRQILYQLSHQGSPKLSEPSW